MASEQGSVRQAATTDREVQRRMSRHLEDALDTDQPSEKNYHIRSVLQRLIVDDDQRD